MDQLEGMSHEEIDEYMKEREARTRAKLLEIIGDLPDADMKPPENVLFVCKLNPVTNDEDLELIFSRFGKINSCEVIRDRKSDDSLCYAFIEFDREEDCENAYLFFTVILSNFRRTRTAPYRTVLHSISSYQTSNRTELFRIETFKPHRKILVFKNNSKFLIIVRYAECSQRIFNKKFEFGTVRFGNGTVRYEFYESSRESL